MAPTHSRRWFSSTCYTSPAWLVIIDVRQASYTICQSKIQIVLVQIRETSVCLGVPMRIVECNGPIARCEAFGISREVSLLLLQHEELKFGDLVMVHVGFAIQKIDEVEAISVWELYDEALVGRGKGNSDA